MINVVQFDVDPEPMYVDIKNVESLPLIRQAF